MQTSAISKAECELYAEGYRDVINGYKSLDKEASSHFYREGMRSAMIDNLLKDMERA